MSNIENISEIIDYQDRLISSKLYQLRTKLGIEREELAKMVNIDKLELENYEQGIEAIPASVLLLISRKLDVDLDYFYSEFTMESEKEEHINDDNNNQSNDSKSFFQNKKLVFM